MRLQYAALVALFLDSVTAVSVRRGAEDIFLQGTGTIEKRADSTTIPAPINVEPSQYWEGNDGTWLVRTGAGSSKDLGNGFLTSI